MKQTFLKLQANSLIEGSIDIALHSVLYWYKHQYATLDITHYHMQSIFFPFPPRALSQLSQSCLCLPSSQFHAAVIVEVHRFVDFRGGIPSMEVNPDWNGVRFNLQRKGQIEWNIAKVWKYHQLCTGKISIVQISILFFSIADKPEKGYMQL